MSEERRSRLAPIPRAVLQAFPGGPTASESSTMEGGDPLRPLHEAEGRRELTALLEPVSSDPQTSLRGVQSELARLFAAHERSLSALRLALSQVQHALEAAPDALPAALASFEELLEALVDRHGLWGERA